MGMFDQWKNFFSVGNTISQSSNTQPDDVLKTKSALAQTGDYKVPDFGITDIPDMGMIDGLKKFQKMNGLKVDGVMKPGGPTEAKLGETMANQGVSNTDLLEAAKPKKKVPKIDQLIGLQEVKMPKLKKPTAKMWEQVAQQQKPKTAVLPEGNTVQQRIASMMQDKRYQDQQDTRLKDHIVQQFKKAFPGEVSYDPTGKMEQPQAAIMPEEVEPFDPDGELQRGIKKASQEEPSEEPVQDEDGKQEEEGTDCASLKKDMDDAYGDWEDADEKASQELSSLQIYVEDADNDWDDFVDVLLNGRVASSDIPEAPHLSKRNTSLDYFLRLLKKAAKIYDVIVRIEDASQAYWKYNRALKAVNASRKKWLELDKDAKKLRRDYNDLKKKHQRNCGK